MLKIGIDAQPIAGRPTGIGNYTRQLLDAAKGVKYFPYDKGIDKDLNVLERVVWERRLRLKAESDGVDILHVPGFAGPYGKGKCKKITTVHDLIPVLYPGKTGFFSGIYWGWWLPLCVSSSDHIIAVSEQTKKDIVALIGYPEEKITVIHEAAGEKFRVMPDKPACRKRLYEETGIDREYLLFVSTVEPRKNVAALIRAYGACGSDIRRKFALVIAGKKAWGYPAAKKVADELDLGGDVLFLDYVCDETLVYLYNCAELFVFPSFYEGFGLPVLEAFACGAPVIASDCSSIPEVAGGAALLIDPLDVDDIRGAICRVLGSKELRNELSQKGIGRSGSFSWKRTAEMTVDVYRRVYEN